MGVKLPPELDDPNAQLTAGLVVPFLRDVAGHFFPLLGGWIAGVDGYLVRSQIQLFF